MAEQQGCGAEEQAQRNAFNKEPRTMLFKLTPWIKKNLPKLEAWFQVIRRYEPTESARLILRCWNSRVWPDYKPDSRDFREWDRERLYQELSGKPGRTLQTFGEHGKEHGVLVAVDRSPHGKKHTLFGFLYIDKFKSEHAIVWFPIAEHSRRWMGGRVWYQSPVTPDGLKKNGWHLSFLPAGAPECWVLQEKPKPAEWPFGLRDFYKHTEAEPPARAMSAESQT